MAIDIRQLLGGLATAAVAGGYIYFGAGSGAPEVGDECRDGWACAGEGEVLKCVGGKFEKFPCRGPDGCQEKGNRVTCDISGNREGDPCQGHRILKSTETRVVGDSGDEDKAACSTDGKEQIYCEGGVTQRIPCRGERGCYPEGSQVICDQSVGVVGDVCAPNTGACTPDGKTMLRCRDGKLVTDTACRGPEGCRNEDGTIRCDHSVAEEGDTCSNAGTACSPDKKHVLGCKDGRFVKVHRCRDRECGDRGNGEPCNLAIAEAGDPCEGGISACSADRKQLLTCDGTAFVLERRVRSCELEGDQIVTR